MRVDLTLWVIGFWLVCAFSFILCLALHSEDGYPGPMQEKGLAKVVITILITLVCIVAGPLFLFKWLYETHKIHRKQALSKEPQEVEQLGNSRENAANQP